MKLKVPKPLSGGLILSYKCNAACRHCMYGCSPKWSGDWISEENLEKILNQLSHTIESSPYGRDSIGLNHGLHFTGGEPFLNFDLLCKAVEMATEMNIPSTFVETNCFWCIDDKNTKEKLKHLKSLGMKGIMISVNPFYLEYVPFERTKTCVEISSEVFGNNAIVYQLEYFRRFQMLGIKGKVSIDDYIKMERGVNFLSFTEFFMMGRATYELGESLLKCFPRYQASQLLNQPCITPILREWHNHFDNYGNYMPGFCGGITLGNCRNLINLLQVGIELKDVPVLGFLVTDDFSGLMRFAKEFGYEELKKGYYSKCQLCVDVRKFLVEKDDFKELQPKEFYIHIDKTL